MGIELREQHGSHSAVGTEDRLPAEEEEKPDRARDDNRARSDRAAVHVLETLGQSEIRGQHPRRVDRDEERDESFFTLLAMGLLMRKALY